MQRLKAMVVCAGVFVAAGCGVVDGSGVRIEETRQTPEFTAIKVSDGIELKVQAGETKKVRLVGDDNLVPEVRAAVRDDTLVIEMPEVMSWKSSLGLVAHVSVPSLRSIERSGGGSVVVQGLDEPRFQVKFSGGGTAVLSGVADSLDLRSSGGVVVDASDLDVRDASLTVSGGGLVEARVSDTLELDMSGGSVAEIHGRPRVRRSHLSGGSSLRYR